MGGPAAPCAAGAAGLTPAGSCGPASVMLVCGAKLGSSAATWVRAIGVDSTPGEAEAMAPPPAPVLIGPRPCNEAVTVPGAAGAPGSGARRAASTTWMWSPSSTAVRPLARKPATIACLLVRRQVAGAQVERVADIVLRAGACAWLSRADVTSSGRFSVP